MNILPAFGRALRGGAALLVGLGAGVALLVSGCGPDATVTPAPPTSTPAPPQPTTTPLPPPTVTPTLPFAALPSPIAYAALGASDTVGEGADDPDTGNWAAQLAAKLPPGTQLQRFARSGNTLGEALTAQVPRAIASNPDLITVWLVINDALKGVPLDTYRGQLHTLLTRLTEETHAPIVLLNSPDVSLILPANATPTTRTTVQAITQGWNRQIAEEAALFPDRVLLVDLYAPSQAGGGRRDWVSSDNFHPSTAGYGALAEVVYQAMVTAGLVRP